MCLQRQSSHDTRELRKPKIVNEILKTSNNNNNQNNYKHPTILNRNREGQKHSREEPKSKYNESYSHNQKEVSKKQMIGENEIVIRKLNVEERVRSMQKEAMRRSKSVADEEIGDLVKGNVNQILYRIKSREELSYEEKKEVINEKERPRKKSVLAKIALFEVRVTLNYKFFNLSLKNNILTT